MSKRTEISLHNVTGFAPSGARIEFTSVVKMVVIQDEPEEHRFLDAPIWYFTQPEVRVELAVEKNPGGALFQLILPPSDHDHVPIQHRDGKQPWCKVCGLTGELKVPESKLP